MNGNPAVFNLPNQHGYHVHITIFAQTNLGLGILTPAFNTFHVTWEWNPGAGVVRAHYYYDEILANNRVAYQERPNQPQTDPGWGFINPMHPQTLRNTSLALATELANDINAKYFPTHNC